MLEALSVLMNGLADLAAADLDFHERAKRRALTMALGVAELPWSADEQVQVLQTLWPQTPAVTTAVRLLEQLGLWPLVGIHAKDRYEFSILDRSEGRDVPVSLPIAPALIWLTAWLQRGLEGEPLIEGWDDHGKLKGWLTRNPPNSEARIIHAFRETLVAMFDPRRAWGNWIYDIADLEDVGFWEIYDRFRDALDDVVLRQETSDAASRLWGGILPRVPVVHRFDDGWIAVRRQDEITLLRRHSKGYVGVVSFAHQPWGGTTGLAMRGSFLPPASVLPKLRTLLAKHLKETRVQVTLGNLKPPPNESLIELQRGILPWILPPNHPLFQRFFGLTEMERPIPPLGNTWIGLRAYELRRMMGPAFDEAKRLALSTPGRAAWWTGTVEGPTPEAQRAALAHPEVALRYAEILQEGGYPVPDELRQAVLREPNLALKLAQAAGNGPDILRALEQAPVGSVALVQIASYVADYPRVKPTEALRRHILTGAHEALEEGDRKTARWALDVLVKWDRNAMHHASTPFYRRQSAGRDDARRIAVALGPYHAYHYAFNTLDRHPSLRAAVLEDPAYALYWAQRIDGAPRDDTRQATFADPQHIDVIDYATSVDRGPHPMTTAHIEQLRHDGPRRGDDEDVDFAMDSYLKLAAHGEDWTDLEPSVIQRRLSCYLDATELVQLGEFLDALREAISFARRHRLHLANVDGRIWRHRPGQASPPSSFNRAIYPRTVINNREVLKYIGGRLLKFPVYGRCSDEQIQWTIELFIPWGTPMQKWVTDRDPNVWEWRDTAKLAGVTTWRDIQRLSRPS